MLCFSYFSCVQYWGDPSRLGNSGIFISYDVEPFAQNWPSFQSNPNKAAWPHKKYLSPLDIYFAWPPGVSDDTLLSALAQTKSNIIKAAEEDGQDLSTRYTYPNYALGTDSLESVFGPNVHELRSLAAKYDPKRVMTRTGGFIFQKE